MSAPFIFETPRTRLIRWLTHMDDELPGEIRRRLFATTFTELAPVWVGVSVGPVLIDRTHHLATAVAEADQALYCAKSSGKGRCIVFDPAQSACTRDQAAPAALSA